MTRLHRGATAIVVGITIALSACSPPADHSAEDAQFIAQHGSDPKALDDRFGSYAQSACSVGADDYLRQQTNREFKWSEDAQGFTGVKFASISTASAGLGMLTLFTDRALVSNGLGSFETFQFYCLYDAANKKVLQYSPDDPGMAAAGKAAAADNASDAAPTSEADGSNVLDPEGKSSEDEQSSNKLTAIFDHCDPATAPRDLCTSNFVMPIWRRFKTSFGDFIGVNVNSVARDRNGAADVSTYRFVPGAPFNGYNLKEYYFTCDGMYHEANTSGTMLPAKPGSAAGRISAAVCAIAARLPPLPVPPQQSFNPPDHPIGGQENEVIPDGPIAPPNFQPSNPQ